MDDEPETDSGEQQEIDIEEIQDGVEAVADEPFKPTFNRAVSEKVAEHGKERLLADSPRGRISIREKLAEMVFKIEKEKINGKVLKKQERIEH